MTDAALWVVAGLLLCGAELVAPGVFLLWIGLAACGTGLLVAAVGLVGHALAGPAQIVVFVVLASVSAGVAARRLRQRPGQDTVNAPSAGLIGVNCIALAFHACDGRVSLRDGTWQARIAAGPDPTAGETLRIVGLDGTILLVERLT